MFNQVALSSFYEHGGNIDDIPTEASSQEAPRAMVLSDSDMESPPSSPKVQKKDKKSKKTTNSNFATLSSLQQDSSSDEEEGIIIFL